MGKRSTLRIWTPRVLSIVFVLFLMMFSLDVFEPGLSAKQIALALFMHNIPALILLAILVISWKFEIVGGIVFLLAGIAYIVWVVAISGFGGNIWLPSLIIGGPALLVGILFIVNWMKKRKLSG